MVTFASQETRVSMVGTHMPSSGNLSSASESANVSTDAPLIFDGTSRRSDGDLSQSSNTVIQSAQTSQNGISIFQGYAECLFVLHILHELDAVISLIFEMPTKVPNQNGLKRSIPVYSIRGREAI